MNLRKLNSALLSGEAPPIKPPASLTEVPPKPSAFFVDAGSTVPLWRQQPGDQHLAQLAKILHSCRTKRRAFLAGDLLAEPAWDMLLDLFLHHVQGKELRTTSVCLASNTPPTTALRWIWVLEGEGILERHDDPADHRMKIVRLSPRGVDAMRGCLLEYWEQLSTFAGLFETGGD